MKKNSREQSLPHRAGLFHHYRPTPLAIALFCLFPIASQATLGLPPLEVDPMLLRSAPRAKTTTEPKPVVVQAPQAPIEIKPVIPEIKSQPAPINVPAQVEIMAQISTEPVEQIEPIKPIAQLDDIIETLKNSTPIQTEIYTVAANDKPVWLKPSRSLSIAPPPGTPSTPVFVDGLRTQGHHDIETEVIGDAEIRQWGQIITADQLRYNKPEDEVYGKGNVKIIQKGDTTEGSELKLKMDKKEGFLQQPVFQLTQQKPAGRGDAKILLFEGENQYRMENARYTTCQAGSDDWYLHAGDLEINRTTQIGTATHAYIDFMGTPILYTPWMNFALNSQRKSGFLTPSYGSTIDSGTEFSLPYYWNIAPNRDATITPRYMMKRGTQVKSEFRYIDKKYIGTANLEILPNDQQANLDRSIVTLKHNHALGNGWLGALTLERASDDNYFRDLSNNIGITSQVNLLREGILTNAGVYQGTHWNFAARSQSFQILQDPLAPIVTPYRRTQMALSGGKNIKWKDNDFSSGLNLGLNTEWVHFSHPNLFNAQRLNLYPTVSLPLTQIYGYVTPSIGLHNTNYSFDDSMTAQPDIHRSLPIFTLDSGIYFERDVNLFNTNYQQTLEPRLYYVRTPFRDQRQIPIFDSGDGGFGIPQIFTANRFAGIDRISDANQITMGITSRFLDESGAEKLSSTLAQRYFLSLPQVTLPGGTPPIRKYSDLLASVGGHPTNALALYTLWQYNPEIKQTGSFSLVGRYHPSPGKILNVSYRYLPGPTTIGLQQIDTSIQWPITGRWNGLARWNRSILDSRDLEGLSGIEYNAGCWAFRTVFHTFVTSTSKRSDSIFFQLELNGIGTFGSNPLSELKRNITGYIKTTELPNENTFNESR